MAARACRKFFDLHKAHGSPIAKVHFRIFVLNIDAIDDANQSFMANVFIHLRWQDGRLAMQGTTRQMRLEDVWNPQVILANRQGLVSRSLFNVVQVDADGTVTYRQRYSGMLSQPLQLSDFPMDRHRYAKLHRAFSTRCRRLLPRSRKRPGSSASTRSSGSGGGVAVIRQASSSPASADQTMPRAPKPLIR
jgi:hypothetical protein